VSRRSADTALRHISELVRAAGAGVNSETDSVKWSESLDGRLRERLAGCGLVASNGRRKTETVRVLGPFIDAYIAKLSDAKPSTITNYRHARQWLVEYFREQMLLADMARAVCESVGVASDGASGDISRPCCEFMDGAQQPSGREALFAGDAGSLVESDRR
jgi:hypothetical protein